MKYEYCNAICLSPQTPATIQYRCYMVIEFHTVQYRYFSTVKPRHGTAGPHHHCYAIILMYVRRQYIFHAAESPSFWYRYRVRHPSTSYQLSLIYPYKTILTTMVSPRRLLSASMLRWWVLATVVWTCSSKKQVVKRLNNLDYLDAAALRYYLSAPQADYDVAVMFYAQWCKNCHALASVWDQISKILKAGTTDSKVIVGLFDCETNAENSELCDSAGVKHYPTLAFFSLAGNNHHLAHKAPKHMTKYAANWKHGEALLDWIQAMSALAQWHRSGWGKRIRSFLFGKKAKKAPEPLPLGVPKPIADQRELQQLRVETNKTKALAVRSSALVEVLLVPVQEKGAPVIADNGKNYTDVYALLQETNSWKEDALISDQILRMCVSEIALDYCSRLSTQYTETWIDNWPLHMQITEDAYKAFQTQLRQDLAIKEPFCAVMDDCVVANFTDKKCQPKTCPFVDRTVCRYLTGCLTDQLQYEYAAALKLLPNQKQQKRQESEKSGSFSWGL